MKYLLYILLIAIFSACSQKEANNYDDLTKIRAYIEIAEAYRPELPIARVKMKQEIEQNLAEHYPGVSNVYGIGTWNNLEMDTSSMKEFNLSLLEGILRDTLNYFLVTANKQTDTIIDIISYNEINNELMGVYSHSTKGNRDGIRVEFSRDISTPDSIQIQMIELEIPESSGKMEVYDIYLDESLIFEKLSDKEYYSGKYELITDSTYASLHVKDQQNESTIPYKFTYKSTGDCYTFTASNYAPYRNNEFFPKEHMSIQLTEGMALLNMINWINHCDEQISSIAEMKKIDNKG